MPSRWSPGPIYDLPSSVSLKGGYSFGMSSREKKNNNIFDSSIDMTFAIPDNQKYKFKGCHGALFGMEQRETIKNAVILKDSPQVFFGRFSPGPVAYNANALVVQRREPSHFFGMKTKILSQSQTPSDVGPGIYPKPSAVGPQVESQKKGLPMISFAKAPRHPKIMNRIQPITEVNIPASIGKQPSSLLKNAPCAVFGTAHRDKVAKTALCLTGKERGNEPLAPLRINHPRLPIQQHVIKYS